MRPDSSDIGHWVEYPRFWACDDRQGYRLEIPAGFCIDQAAQPMPPGWWVTGESKLLEELGFQQHRDNAQGLWLGLNEPHQHAHERWHFYSPNAVSSKDSNDARWYRYMSKTHSWLGSTGISSDLRGLLISVNSMVVARVARNLPMLTRAAQVSATQYFNGTGRGVDLTSTQILDLHEVFYHAEAWAARHGFEGMPKELVLRIHGLSVADWLT